MRDKKRPTVTIVTKSCDREARITVQEPAERIGPFFFASRSLLETCVHVMHGY